MCCPPPHCCSGVKTLSSADNEESAASWVIRMKSLAEEKKKAEKKVFHSPPHPFIMQYYTEAQYRLKSLSVFFVIAPIIQCKKLDSLFLKYCF